MVYIGIFFWLCTGTGLDSGRTGLIGGMVVFKRCFTIYGMAFPFCISGRA
jgi:hypothetical protein